MHDEVALRLNLVLKSDLIAFKLRNSVGTQLILFIELTTLRIKCLLLLVELHLALLSKSLQRFCLLDQLLVIGLQLLCQESDLPILLRHLLIERLTQLLNLFVHLVLDFLGFLLQEQDLILVVNFGLGKPLVALVSYI